MTVTILWSMAAAAALTLAGVHLLVWVQDRAARPNLMFSITALAVAGLAPAELGMMHAASPAEYLEWARWYHLPAFFAMVGTVLFVRLHFGTGRAWLMWTVIALRCIVLAGNFLLPSPSFTWREIQSLTTIRFLGDDVSAIAQATVGPGQWLATVSMILFAVFVIDAAVALWRRGSVDAKRKALVVGGGIMAFVAVTAVQTQLMVWGMFPMPLLVCPTFLVAIGAMAFDLSREVFLSRRMQRESDQLRRELAHAGRVSMLGTLSAAIAHELNQPLGAILFNVEAAELVLQQPAPDLAELRGIVEDIRKDDVRAGAVIDRLRALFTRGTVDLQPIALDGVVRDVIALVHTSATERRVAIDCAVVPSLPHAVGDRVHVTQVLLNLIVNGMDAITESGTADRRLTIAVRAAADDMIEVSVADSGPGIRSEHLPRVFDPFFTTKPAGMGMGLPVSRTIITAHGGRLWTENNADGPGATFRFTLPVSNGTSTALESSATVH